MLLAGCVCVCTQGKGKEAVHSETRRRVAIKIVNKLQLRKIKNAEETRAAQMRVWEQQRLRTAETRRRDCELRHEAEAERQRQRGRDVEGQSLQSRRARRID